MLEAFELSEEVGDKALTADELFFMADARKRKGCRLLKTRLTDEEVQRVLVLGLKCRKWKERNR
jgi:hypothetical protein